MTQSLTSKRTVLVTILVAASIILISGSRQWLSGTVADSVLGVSTLHGAGADVAPGALAAALVGLASAVAAATSGPFVRVVAACSALIAAVLGATVVIVVLADPASALGKLAAAGTGRSDGFATHAQAGSWVWVALVAMAAMGLAAVGALVGGPRWTGLSSRYDSGQPAAEHLSDWDRLSRGEDPTAEHEAGGAKKLD